MSKSKIPQIALIGMPNSGKSTLFNRLTRSAHAIVSEIAHTTRDTNRKFTSLEGREFEIIDTAGFQKDSGQISKLAMGQLQTSLSDASVIIFVVDSTVELSSGDTALAKLVRSTGRPVVVALNKADDRNNAVAITAFRRLGYEQMLQVSAIHNTGIDELIHTVVSLVPARAKASNKPITTDIKVAILGRPNVGKSSLLNGLAGKYLAIEADIAGTTRDTNEFSVTHKSTQITFIDTAGLRRPGKIAKSENIEFYSKVRTMRAIENADICLMLIDAGEPATAQDLHLFGMVKDANRGLIVVVTKWDTIEKDTYTMPKFAEFIRSKLQFVWWAPIVFTSAKTKQNLSQLLDVISEVNSRLDFSLSTSKFNRFLEDANAKNPPSAVKTKKPKVNYGTQTGTHPPEFTIFTTHPEYMHFSYTRYLENQLREQFDLNGVPVAIKYKSKYKEGNRDRYKTK